MPIELPKGLPFSVDTWTVPSKRKRYHFLTHAHKDHSTGISIHGSLPIYATHITKFLLLQQFPQLDDSIFVEIKVGESLVIEDPDGSFSVTPFDANHCPGAIMLLFEGDFGNILHTGDCRLTSDCLQNLPVQYMVKKGKYPNRCLDYLFLDCTFGRYPTKIPSKNFAIQQVTNCIWKHPDAPIVYLICDLLGQEEILLEVSRTFGSMIYVDKSRNTECFQALSIIAPDILSHDPSCRFQVCEGSPGLYERAKEKLLNARVKLQPEPLFIRPSVQWYTLEEQIMSEKQSKQRWKEAERDKFGVWHICYSMHSSREELEWALQLLQPKRVVSTTPSCRAVELDYVRNHCCGSITADDPLWKLMKIRPKRPISPKACKIPESASWPKPSSVNCELLEHKKLCTDHVEVDLHSSPPSAGPITLFGRARLGILDRSPLNYEKKTLSINTDTLQVVIDEVATVNYEKKSISIHTDTLQVVADKEVAGTLLSGETNAVSNAQNHCSEHEMENGVEKSDSCVGSSRNFDLSLRKFYRSMNVSVPRPLPSLTELMSIAKRAKIHLDRR